LAGDPGQHRRLLAKGGYEEAIRSELAGEDAKLDQGLGVQPPAENERVVGSLGERLDHPVALPEGRVDHRRLGLHSFNISFTASMTGLSVDGLAGVAARPESGDFPSKRAVARSHPRRLVDLFGVVHNPRLKPEGLVETVGDLAEVMLHGLLLDWRSLHHRAVVHSPFDYGDL